jgi:uncharacterized delta-60 repeat protein
LESRQLLSGGALDTSFSGDGKASAPFDASGVTGNGMAVQADGKIVEVGKVADGNFSLVRFNADGSLDTSFGSHGTGKISTHVGDFQNVEAAFAVAIQSDGKIVVLAADQGHPDAMGGDFDMVVARFTSSGSFDNSFGHGGFVRLSNFDSHTSIGVDPSAIAIQHDGKIVVAGAEEQGAFALGGANDNFVIGRLNTNGTLDTSFNGDGKANIDLGENEEAEGMAIDYNGTAATNSDFGKIVVVGHQTEDDESQDAEKVVVARYNTNGSMDKSFNKTGILLTSAGDTAKSTDAEAVAIEAGGAIVIAGHAGKNMGSTDHHFFMARFNVSGTLDKTFGGGSTGGVVTSFGGTGNDNATSIVIGGLGQQLIAGGISNGKFALAAYSLDGHPISTFGGGGQVTTTIGDAGPHVQLALSPNRTIVAAGGVNFITARYFDIYPNVSITAPDNTAGPTTTKIVFVGKKPIVTKVPNNASMVVTRDENLNIATRVFFTVSGSGLAPSPINGKAKKNNYTLTGMTILPALATAKTFSGYVDIPAGQTSTTVTLTPTNIAATNETATFAIQSNVNYVISSPANQTITLLGTNQTPPPPTTTTLTDTADTYIQDGSSADTNFGTATQLLVKKSSTTGQNRETYLKFDLSSLSTVNSVKLNLFGALNNTDSPSLVTQVFSIADNSWLETGITWNKKRTPGATALASATITGTTPALYTFDVTAYVKAQLAAGNKTISLVLINSANTSPAVIFNSKEAASNKPTLVVT